MSWRLLILQGRFNLKRLGHLPEAQEMVAAMLAGQTAKRPTMQGIMAQPFWWSPARRLAFLIHLSDRVETEDREVFCFISTCFISKFIPTIFNPKTPFLGFITNLCLVLFLVVSFLDFSCNIVPKQHYSSDPTPLHILDPPLPTVINTIPPMYGNMANFTWLQSVKPDMCLLPCMLMRLC